MADLWRSGVIRTGRLDVRPYAAGDEADVRAVRTHPAVAGRTRPVADDWYAAYVARGGDERSADTGRGWLGLAVVLRATGRVIGEVGLWLEPDPPTGDLGFLIHPDCQRQGYATEAARVALGLAFGPLQRVRVTAGCDADNAPSVAVMCRLGMRPAADDGPAGHRFELDAGDWERGE